ncbi:site-specific integrase [Pedobacter xixiisoli]|uniref:Phage integrase SAM-like domain-containing protein n=1 Tax=Pedobacter xixiisoli TaxID=1476464 RepID=A0A285ZS01_9SPHI|nr:site-specific integrase [Pedobacter xixiisoli]SOD12397.1 Phage integrase SAM-like domain-containing protein [Pedobacter xixiisoli]
MAKPKFYLDTAKSARDTQAIKMMYSFNGQRLKYHTQVSVNEKHFQPKCNTSTNIKPVKTIAPYGEQHNKRLADIALDAVNIVTAAKGDELTVKYVREQLDLIYKPKPAKPDPTPEIKHNLITYLEQIIADSTSGKRLISSGKSAGNRYTRNTIKNYGITVSALKRYMKHNKINTLHFETINKAFYEDFRFYCYDVEKKEVSTFAGYVKDIKMAMNEIGSTAFKSKDFVKPSYEADTIYLTLEQIDKIASLDLSDYKKHIDLKKGNRVEKLSYASLDKVRDLFLIGCYTGLRFSDFNTLELKSIENNFINVKQVKTGGRITIPIMSRLRPVLNKYLSNLPTLSNQKFNDYIKEVAKLAGLTEERKITDTRGNIKNESFHPLYNLITSHCCRRSYATNMFKAGVPPMLIMSATGHKTETSFLKYIRANNEDKANLLAETLKKLGL